jgi:hypothetical protein
MQDKQKVTLYLPPVLHRQLKIKAAVEAESMSGLVEKAIAFYLHHPEAVENSTLHGSTHQIHNCPSCTVPLVIRDGDLVQVESYPTVIAEELAIDKVRSDADSWSETPGELVGSCSIR